MKYRLLFSLLIVLFTVNSFAQDQYTKEKLNRIVPLSPNAASLGIFGNIPVGHHTGVPQISIPIHEIDLHGLKIPIELSYHASGIKVAQEASSVGLGWALNAGGCISRNILHLDDFKSGYGNYVSLRAKPLPQHAEDEDPVFNSRDYLLFMGFENTYDAEPDFFSYSFCTHSGSFYLQPRNVSNGIASIVGNENSVQIKYIESTNSWEVIDAYGFKYIFGSSEETRETSQTYSRPGMYTTNIRSIGWFGFESKDQYPSVTAWYLEAIISPLNDTIKFKYKKERILSKYQFSEEKYFRLDYYNTDLESLRDEYNYSSISYSSNEQLLLSSIEYTGGSITFEYETRTDLQLSHVSNISQKLTSISVYENMTSGTYGGRKKVKYCTLAHSYMGNATNYEDSRLMLNEVCFIPVDNLTTDIQKYQFTYAGALSSKYSQAVDYWGYSNAGNFIQGSRRNTEICPFIYLDYSWHWQTLSFGGRDRRPNEIYAKRGMLSSIKYPTGGKTVFEFELNDFAGKIKVGTPSGNVDLSHGGGLRVKRIIDLSNDMDTVSIRRFVYQKDNISSGRLKIVPVHHRQINLSEDYAGSFLPYLTGYRIPYLNIHSEGFSSSILNSGNVGYSYVEEHNVTDGKRNGYTAYHFYNAGGRVTTSVFGLPTIISSTNGKPYEIVHFNRDGTPVKKQTISYKTFDRGTISGFKCYAPPMYDSYLLANNKIENEFKVEYYTMHSDCYLESKITEEEYLLNGTLRRIIEYDYDETFNLKNYQKTFINEDVYETYIKYPYNFTDNTFVNMRNKHIIGVPVETINTFNGRVINAQKTLYSVFETNEEPCFLPVSIYNLNTNQPLGLSEYQNYYAKEVQIDVYDSFGNVLQYTDRNNLKIVYLWSYGIYPIAVIKNATVDAVDIALGNLGALIEDLAWWRPDFNYLYELQEQLPNAQIALFTHKPHVGVTSISNPSGKTIHYDYDGLGRLIHIGNGNNHKIESYNYNYSNR